MKFQFAQRRRPWRPVLWPLLWTCLTAVLFVGCQPPGPAALLEGRKLLERGDARAAILPLHDAVQILSTNGLAWSYLGLAYQQSEQLSNAVACYLQALRWDRDLVDVRYNLGMAYLDLGRPVDARLELTTFTLQRPKAVPGWVARGSAELRTKDAAAALSSFSTALRLSPTNAAALNGLGLALIQRGRPREAAPYFTAAVQQQPSFAAAWRNLATVQQVHLKDLAAARHTWQQYAALTPPPADLDAVRALLRQLEPPPPPVLANTNPVAIPATNTNVARPTPPPVRPTVTNPPVAPTTNAVVPVRPPPTNPAVVRPAPVTNPPVVVRPPPPANKPVARVAPVVPPPPPERTNPPLEVVQLPDLAPIPPPLDLRPTLPPPPARAPSPPATTSAPPVVVTPAVPDESAADAEAKRGFFAKLNPMNLFKKKPKEELRPTRLPPPPPTDAFPPLPPPFLPTVSNPPAPVVVAAPTSAPPVLVTPAPRTPPPRTVTPPPVSPRYAYTRPARPAAGNRAEASRAFSAGIEAQQASQLQPALEAYQRATLADPQFFEAWNNLGLAAHDLGKSDTALAAFENALALRPDSAEVRYNFAVTLRDAAYPLDAASELQQVLTVNPADVRTQLALGNLYAQRLKDPQKARNYYRKLLELDPNHAQAAAVRAWLRNNPD